MIHAETMDYFHGKTRCKGYLVYDEKIQTKRPAILVSHAWFGQNPFVREKAEALAKLGYIGFAIDMYGNGELASDEEGAKRLMIPLQEDRRLLRDRIHAAVDAVKKHPKVDERKVGAIGYCFGGTCVLELAKSGADVRGVVSFHGVLGNPRKFNVKKAPTAARIGASILVLHGHLDPLVSQQDIEDFEKEMSDAHADWQIHVYGDAMHGFTNPQAKDPKTGLLYNPRADARSWKAMRAFFEEIFE